MIALAAILSLASPAAQAQQTLAVQRVEPPPHVIEGLRKVILLNDGTPLGARSVDLISRSLRSRLGYRPLREADPGMRSDIVDFEIVRHRGNTLSAQQVERVTQLHDAQALVSATATGRVLLDQGYAAEVPRTVVNEETGESTVENVTVPCIRRAVELAVDFTLYDGAGAERASLRRTQRDQQEGCDTDLDAPGVIDVPSSEQMIDALLGRETGAFAFAFVPSWRTLQLQLAGDAVTRHVIRQAASADWAGAVAGALRVLADDPYNAQATMVIAAALELHGRADDAAAVYTLADRFRSNRLAQTGQLRAANRAQQLELLDRAFGLTPQRWDHEGMDAIVARAKRALTLPVAGQPGTVKGRRNRRHPVYAEANRRSTVITSAPGRAEVRVLRRQGPYIEIQLPDGETGWMRRNAVR